MDFMNYQHTSSVLILSKNGLYCNCLGGIVLSRTQAKKKDLGETLISINSP